MNIPGVPAAAVVSIAGGSDGAIYVIDSATVKKFASDGRFLSNVGDEGWGPGHFEMPWGLACDSRNNLYVVDLQAGRVNIFDTRARLVDSIAVSALGFAPIGVRVGPTGDVYLGGLPRPPKPLGPLLYRFNKGGELVSSFFPQDQLVNTLNLTVVGGVAFDSDSEGNVYAVQPVSPRVSVYSPEGHLIRQFGDSPPYYNPPTAFPNPLPSNHSDVEALLSQWTQLAAINVIDAEHVVLLTFSVHSSVPYVVEIYKEDGHHLAGSIGTTMLPAFSDRDGHIYFYDRSQKQLSLTEAALVPTLGGEQ